MTLSSGTSDLNFLRFRQLANPLVIVELLRGRVFFSLHEHELRVEKESTLFRQVTNCPIDREDVEAPEQAPPLASSCEGDDGIQVFLPFASGTKSTHWRQFDVRERSDSRFAAALFPDCASRCFVPATSPSNTRRLGTLGTRRMSFTARAPWNQGCGPVFLTVGRALRLSTHKSFSWLC